MGFGTLALIALIGLLGPLLALPHRWHLPVVLGELIAGIALGATGFRVLHADDQTFTLMADIGFALVMFVAGSHVPVRDPAIPKGMRTGLVRAVAVGAVSAALGVAIAAAFDTGHGALYAVLLASSSAALVLPIVDSLRLGGPAVLALLPQVAIADTACIVALPLVIEPSRAGRSALGAAAVSAVALACFFVLREVERRGWRRPVHRWSDKRRFAVELRVSLAILFALAALAVQTHVSIMLAGFSFGLAVAGIGEPRRLARQLFALTEGFFAPLFFVWLGASLNLRELGDHPKYIALGFTLGIAAVVSHCVLVLMRQPLAVGALAAAQLGVPVAAATVGSQLGLLAAGEAPALLLGALVCIGAASLAGARMAASGRYASPADTSPPAAPSSR